MKLSHENTRNLVDTEIVYPFKATVEIDWPYRTVHDGTGYVITGKGGVNIKTGLPSAEYKNATDGRVWLLSNGEVIPD